MLYDHHRWVLPVACEAQRAGLLPIPCTIVTFDRHHDTREPPQELRTELARVRSAGCRVADVVAVAGSRLSTINDDWLLAGMDIGLIGNAVIVGVERSWDAPEEFQESDGTTHRIFLSSLPREALGYQGDLSDLARREALKPLWDTLGWGRVPGGQFGFTELANPILLDFDLDCFTLTWRGYVLPWPDEVFRKEFTEPSQQWGTIGLTGKDFIVGLLRKAGVVTIAREPVCCGGMDKAIQVLASLDRYLLDGVLASQRGK